MLQRTVLLIVLWFCNVCLYLSRTNITVAVIYMFPTDENIEGSLLAAFYWGYLISQVPGGWLASRYGSKKTLSCAVLIWSLSTLFTGFVGKSVPILFILRVAVGIAEGANYPSQMKFISMWIPFQERSAAWSFVTSGEAMGTIIALVGGPFLAHEYGWESVFWISGISSLLWLIAFVVLTSSIPSTHSKITMKELNYIQKNRPNQGAATETTATSSTSTNNATVDGSDKQHRGHKPTPWCEIITNKRMMVVVATHCCYSFGYYVCLSWIQKFFSVCYHADYSKLGILSVLPYVVLFCTLTVAGNLADKVESYFQFSATTIRKIFNSIGMFGAGFFFFMLSLHAPSHIDLEPSITVNGTSTNGTVVTTMATAAENRDARIAAILLACAIGMGGFAGGAGYWNALGDLSVEYSSIVCAISSSIASIPGIIGGKLVGSLLTSTGENWSLIFQIAAFVEIFGAVVFVIGGSAEDQLFGVVDKKKRRNMRSSSSRLNDIDSDFTLMVNEVVDGDEENQHVRSRSNRSTRSDVESR